MEGMISVVLDHSGLDEFKTCNELYGRENQEDVCIEELAEFVQQVIHSRRCRRYPNAREMDRENLVEECADAIIMILQTYCAEFGYTSEAIQHLNLELNSKLNRQYKRNALYLESIGNVKDHDEEDNDEREVYS